MKKLSLFGLAVCIAILGAQSDAQTNVAPTISSNWITAAKEFREVDGKLYNINRSVLWHGHDGKFLKVSTNGIVVQMFTTEPVYQAATTSRETHNSWGGISGYRTVPTTVQVDTKEVPDVKCCLRNYPKTLSPAVGQKAFFWAMKTGTTNVDDEMLELWDYGLPHIVMVVTTNNLPTLKANKK